MGPGDATDIVYDMTTLARPKSRRNTHTSQETAALTELIGWHDREHSGGFADCQDEPCVIIVDGRAPAECTCVWTGVRGEYDQSSCELCNPERWLPTVPADEVLAAVRAFHGAEDHHEPSLFCDREPCRTIERSHFFSEATQLRSLVR